MALVAVMSLTASAQVYVGGSVGLWRDYNANETSFNLIPEVGYNLSDKWAIGLQIGYVHDYKGGVDLDLDFFQGRFGSQKTNGLVIKPYARWSYAEFGPVRLFLDMGFGFDTYKTKVEVGDRTVKSDPFNAWEIGVSPGLAVSLTENLDFIAHVGFLGFRDSDDGSAAKFGRDGFGFNVDGNNLNFGLYYNF